MKQVFGPKVKVSLPKSYHSADASKSKFLVFKGVSINITIDEFKELLDFRKITHAEAERMKSKRTAKNLPFIKIKTGIIFRVEEFKDNTLDPTMLQVPRFRAQGTKLYEKSEMCCVWWSSFTQKLSK